MRDLIQPYEERADKISALSLMCPAGRLHFRVKISDETGKGNHLAERQGCALLPAI